MTNSISSLNNQNYGIFTSNVNSVLSDNIQQVKTSYVQSPIQKEEIKPVARQNISFKSNATDKDLYKAFKSIHSLGAANLYTASQTPKMFTRMFIG